MVKKAIRDQMRRAQFFASIGEIRSCANVPVTAFCFCPTEGSNEVNHFLLLRLCLRVWKGATKGVTRILAPLVACVRFEAGVTMRDCSRAFRQSLSRSNKLKLMSESLQP